LQRRTQNSARTNTKIFVIDFPGVCLFLALFNIYPSFSDDINVIITQGVLAVSASAAHSVHSAAEF
jgi:hypothetical protein